MQPDKPLRLLSREINKLPRIRIFQVTSLHRIFYANMFFPRRIVCPAVIVVVLQVLHKYKNSFPNNVHALISHLLQMVFFINTLFSDIFKLLYF
jgi:hypothetical protein